MVGDVPLSRGGRAAILVSATIGILLIALGFLMDAQWSARWSYAASVLANVGTAFLLAAPLIYLERLLVRTGRAVAEIDDRVSEVSRATADIDERLAALSARTQQRIDEQREHDLSDLLDPVRRMLDEPSSETVFEALSQAVRERATGREVFVAPAGETVALGFRADDEQFPPVVVVRALPLQARLVVPHKRQVIPPWRRGITTVHWRRGTPVEGLFVALDQQTRLPATLGAGEVIAALARTLDLALRRRSDSAEGGGTLLAVPTEHWVVFGDRLEHPDPPRQLFTAKDILGRLGAVPPEDVLTASPHPDELAFAWLVALRCWRN